VKFPGLAPRTSISAAFCRIGKPDKRCAAADAAGAMMSELRELPWYAHVPVNVFGMVLGLAGLGHLWRQATDLGGYATAVADALFVVAALCFVALALAYSAKAARHPVAVARDLRHPIRHCFFAAISMSMLLLAGAAARLSPDLARGLWLAGAILQFAVAVICTSLWLQNTFAVEQAGPAWFLPIIGGAIGPIMPVEGATSELSWAMFSLAAGLGLPVVALVLFRVAFRPPPPPPALPTLAILIAPAPILFLAWLKLNGGVLDPFARALYFFGLAMTLALVAAAPRFIRAPFSVAWWSYTFPVVAMASAAVEFFRHLGSPAFGAIAAGYFLVANAIVLVVLSRTLSALLGRRLFVPE
jgi:tellurite resistance protein